MNSKFSNLEFKYKVQDKFISAISTGVESDIVKFWSSDKRKNLTEEDIDKIYLGSASYYSIRVIITYPKPANTPKDPEKIIQKSNIGPPFFGRNGKYFINSKLLPLNLNLSDGNVQKLRVWVKKATKFLQTYLWDSERLFLREIRFDLIPNKDKTVFTILNLPVESIQLSKESRSEIIDSGEYLQNLYDDYISFINSPYVLWQRKKLKELQNSEEDSSN